MMRKGRLIKTVNGNDGRSAKVWYDDEWQEYTVEFFTDGKHHTHADYFDDDKQSAIDTAQHFVKGN